MQNINNLQEMTGILILIGSLGCLKEVTTMDMILGKCKFPNSFLPYFHKHMLYVQIGLASMRQFQCVPTTYVFSIDEFFTISFFKTNSQPLSLIQRNEHVEMNNFSCSLSCTWMTIKDCLLYASVSLS